MIDDEALRSIEKLHQMKQDGIISDAEFETAKRDLLEGRPKLRSKAAAVIAAPPQLPPDDDHVGWMLLPIQRYADFDGRSCRREFWMFQLIYVVGFLVLGLFGLVVGGMMVATGVYILCAVALLVPQIAVQVRRFHDQDKSGWFALLNLLPYAGTLIILIFMMLDGTPGENKYGPDPKGR